MAGDAVSGGMAGDAVAGGLVTDGIASKGTLPEGIGAEGSVAGAGVVGAAKGAVAGAGVAGAKEGAMTAGIFEDP